MLLLSGVPNLRFNDFEYDNTTSMLLSGIIRIIMELFEQRRPDADGACDEAGDSLEHHQKCSR